MNHNQEQQLQAYNKWSAGLDNMIDTWEQVGLLKNLDDKYHRQIVAVMLENQRLLNTLELDKYAESDHVKQYRRLSIPIVRRLFGKAPFMKWVGIQPALGPNNLLWMKRGENLLTKDILCKTRKLKTQWPYDSLKGNGHNNMDKEAAICADVAASLSDEFCREIASDLCKNVTQYKFSVDVPEKQCLILETAIDFTGEQIKARVGHSPNWMLTSKKFIDLFKSSDEYNFISMPDNAHGGKVYYAGLMGGLDVYCDEGFPDTEMLLGYRGDWHEAGYYFLPYTTISLAAIQLDPNDNFSPRFGLLTRYAKTLERDGRHFYRTIKVDNVIFPQESGPITQVGRLGLGTVIILQKRKLAVDPQDEHPEQSGPGELVPEGEQQSDDTGISGDQDGGDAQG